MKLSVGDKELVGLVAVGLTDDEIATQLQIPTNKVLNHIARLLAKQNSASWLIRPSGRSQTAYRLPLSKDWDRKLIERHARQRTWDVVATEVERFFNSRAKPEGQLRRAST